MADPKLSKRTLIICEGPEDACLLQMMRKKGEIPDCDIKSIGDTGPGRGKDALYTEIISFGLEIRRIERMIFVMDAEDDYTKSFSDVADAVLRANGNRDFAGCLSVPVCPASIVSSAKISTAVQLLPGNGRNGCLDTLVKQVLTRMYPQEAECVDKMFECSAPIMTMARKDKSWVRAVLSIVNTKSPSCTLAKTFRQYPAIIPTSSQEFAELRENVGSWIL